MPVKHKWFVFFMILTSGIATIFALDLSIAVSSGYYVIAPPSPRLAWSLALLPLCAGMSAPQKNSLLFGCMLFGIGFGMLVYFAKLCLDSIPNTWVFLNTLIAHEILQNAALFVALQISIASFAGYAFSWGIESAAEMWRDMARRRRP